MQPAARGWVVRIAYILYGKVISSEPSYPPVDRYQQ